MLDPRIISEIPDAVISYKTGGELGFIGIEEKFYKGIERAVLWDAKDSWMIDKYYRTLQAYRKASRSCMSWNPWKARSFEILYNRLMKDWEHAFTGFWNDHKNQTWWGGKKFQPQDAVLIDNVVTWQGMAHFLRLGAGLSSLYYNVMGIGKATNAPSVIPKNRDTLYDQVALEPASLTGAITTDGNTYKMSAAFSPNIPTSNIKEYAGFTKESGPNNIMLFIAVAAKILAHKAGETKVQCTHHVIFTSRSDAT